MDGADTEVEYLSIGANRQTAIADWHQDGTLAFGADWNICLWRPTNSKAKGITRILGGHTDAVKVVRFLPRPSGVDGPFAYLLTGADDRCLKLWKLDLAASRGECVQTLQEHAGAVNCIAVLSSLVLDRPSGCIFASGAADATIKIWEFEAGAVKLLQSIKTSPKYFPLALSLHSLGGTREAFVLAAAGTKGTIQLFAAAQDGPRLDFRLKATLSGHEGWIRYLDFIPETTAGSESDLLLASASQDKYIRLWRLRRGQEISAVIPTDGEEPPLGALLPRTSPSNKAHRFGVGSDDFFATFEALLLGHEDWIYTARWHRGLGGKLQLLSASADNSLSIWEADPASGIWVTVARLGEVSREKGATTATGSIGGFWTGLWSPDGSSVVTLGRTGSWRLWSYAAQRDQWVQNVSVSGHTRAVTGLAWAKKGEYLLSTSADQTTRLHGEWKKSRSAGGDGTWHELSRPQIHGYDLNCIDVLSDASFVSGADEKLMRVFNKPKAVAQLLDDLAGTTSSGGILDLLPDAANIPVLGLSNKAVVDGDDGDDSPTEPTTATTAAQGPAIDTTHPPFEEALSRHTLWPEAEKLYGHGYEISCLAASHDGRLVASACKASGAAHAVVRLFETARWTEVKPPLAAHSLTTTRLRFSPDDRFLLSVGRDRQWAVFERGRAADGATNAAEGKEASSEVPRYGLVQADPKGHTRMILDAAWAPVGGDGPRIFATAGRDKQVKIWAGGTAGEAAKFGLVGAVANEHSVTAVDFLPRPSDAGNLILAVGTEAGKLRVLSLRVVEKELTVTSVLDVDPSLCLPKAVLQLLWRPEGESEGERRNVPTLAVAGDDSSLRIYKFEGLLKDVEK